MRNYNKEKRAQLLPWAELSQAERNAASSSISERGWESLRSRGPLDVEQEGITIAGRDNMVGLRVSDSVTFYTSLESIIFEGLTNAAGS